MTSQYLRRDVSGYEDRLEAAVKKARSLTTRHLSDWRIAKAGLEEMPSAKEKTWKYDSWLPRAVCLWAQNQVAGNAGMYDDTGEWWAEYTHRDHPWLTVLREYANVDSTVTVTLFGVMLKEVRRRGLEEIYKISLHKMRLAHDMEWRGLTAIKPHLDELDRKYAEESIRAGDACRCIARDYNYDLELPKTGNNLSLKFFCFGRPVEGNSLNPVSGKGVAQRWLDLPVVRTTEGGEPSMDKVAMDEYQTRLGRGGDQWEFVMNLMAKRKRDTARTYMQGYTRFWLPLDPVRLPDYYLLHPALNPTGTDTLRWSSQFPNEQNISKQGMMCLYCFGDGDGDGPDGKCTHCKGKGVDPKNLRFCFGPPPGREWWSLDAKNIELRLPFYKAGEQELIDLFERPDDAPYYGSNHLLNFHTIYADLWNAELGQVCTSCCKGKVVDPSLIGPHCKKKFASTWYQYCKNMGFAKQYGAQQRKVDATAKRIGAYDLIEARFSKLAAYNAKQIRFAAKHGYVETIPDREVCPERGYPLLCTRTDNGKILPTVPLSYHVQGSAMWWTFKAMLRVDAKLREWRKAGFDGYMVMQVHDELVLDLPARGDPSKWVRKGDGADTPENRKLFHSTNLWRIEVIRKLMARGGEDLGVPTPVGAEYHPNNWGEGVGIW
jgi:hypothetical protein